MITTPLLLLALLFQDADALKRGDEYLAKLGKSWSEKLPSDVTIGIYAGAKWCGSAKLTVTAAEKESGATFKAVFEATFAFGDQKNDHRCTVLLSEALATLSVESEESKEKEVQFKKLTVAKGRWTQESRVGNKTTTTEGELEAGALQDDILPLLVFLGVPQDLQFSCVGTETKRYFTFRAAKEKRPFARDGKTAECAVVEMVDSKDDSLARLYVDADGRALQLTMSDDVMRMRPVAAAEMGKDLKDAVPLAEPAKTVLALFQAIKKVDVEAIDGLFDWERCAESMAPGYGEMDGEKKKEALKTFRARLLGVYGSGDMAKKLPAAEELEAIYTPLFKSDEKDGKADVTMPGATFHLLKVTEGAKKGKWVICGMKK